MKKLYILLFPVLLCFSYTINSQTTVLHSFITETNTMYYNSVCTDGVNLYGTKLDGGEFGKGYIYKLKNDNSGYEVLLNFDGENTGSNPCGSLILDGAVLYGVTNWGGQYDRGVIFKINTDGTDFQRVFDFDGTPGVGNAPVSLLLLNNVLYGTAFGGDYQKGILFKIGLDGTGYEKIYDFNTEDGYEPTNPMATDGVSLYGSTSRGGINDSGVLFKIDTDGTSYTVLNYFSGSDIPSGSLVIRNGFIYGTTSQGGSAYRGTLYRIKSNGTGFIVLGDFADLEGSNPQGLIMIDKVLYGMTTNGSDGRGSVYSVDTSGANFNTLVRFNNINGACPIGTLESDGSRLYGYANGGPYNYGVVFSVNTDGSEYTKIKDFEATNDGYDPQGALVNSSVKSYGFTSRGGMYNKGVIYSLNNDGSGYQVIHNFNGEDGAMPVGSLVLQNDTLFGMTAIGGTENNGAAFIYSLADNHFQKIHDFSFPIGSAPTGLSLFGSEIYGMASGGGEDNAGIIFKMKTDGTGFTSLFSLSGTGVFNLMGMPVISDSVLYGMAMTETANNVLFSIHTDGTQFRVLYTSDRIDAGDWGKSLICDGEYLYEITSGGGINNVGVIFKIKTDGTSMEKLIDFNMEIGAVPEAPLVLVDSVLYGTTCLGGATGSGGVFRIRTDGTGFMNFLDFRSCFDLIAEKPQRLPKTTRNNNGYQELSSGSRSFTGSIAIFNDEIYIVATEQGGNGNKAKIFKYFQIPTGIDKEKANTDIKIYPNPASQFINIEGIKQFPSHIMIYNTSGILVKDFMMNNQQLDIDHLPVGIYSILVEGKCFKIVKL